MANRGWRQRNQGLPDGGDDYFDIDDDGISFNEAEGYIQFTDVNLRVISDDAWAIPSTWDIQDRFGNYNGDYSGIVGIELSDPTILGIGQLIQYKWHGNGGTAKTTYGKFANYYTSGDINGGGVVGEYIEANNRVSSNTNYLYGISVTGHAESTVTTEAIGVYGAGLKGNLNGTPKIIGVKGVVAGHSNGTDVFIAGEFEARRQLTGETVSELVAVKPFLNVTNGTVTSGFGINLSDWVFSGGTVDTSYGIYADTSIDIGTTKYFIYSSSTSQSIIAGAVLIASTTLEFAQTFISTDLVVGSTAYTTKSGTFGHRALTVNFYNNSTENSKVNYAFIYTNSYNGTGTSPYVRGIEGLSVTRTTSPKAGGISGADFYALSGSPNGSAYNFGVGATVGTTISGGTVDAANGFVATMQVVNGTAITTATGFVSSFQHAGTGNFGTVYGIRISGWSAFTATNSYGLYIDSSIDRGGTLKYAIYSLSTSPSLFSGSVEVPDVAYDGTTWNGDNTVPTKNSIRDLTEDARPVSTADVFSSQDDLASAPIVLTKNVATGASKIEAIIHFTDASAGVAGIKLDFGGGTATIGSFQALVETNDPSGGASLDTDFLTASTQDYVLAGVPTGFIKITGWLDCSVAGTIQLRVAQNTSNASNMTINKIIYNIIETN